VIGPPPPEVSHDVGEDFLDVLTTDMRLYHRRFDAVRDQYRPSTREWVETGEQRAVSPQAYGEALERRLQQTNAWSAWLDLHRVTAVLEPTIPTVAPLRGNGYDHAGSDYALISLTHLWDWTGLPVAALPAGLGRSGLPVGVSLIGRLHADWDLLALGSVLQGALGVPEPSD
jgi:Asp-tRNA(Asn)/Glu-tRNA(Gln) amidotransferase A subunit family amidase